MDQTPKQQIAEKLRDSSNVLIAVSKSPSVDQLAAAMALSLMLGELDKHATAVFSGQIPDTMQFLEPEKRFDRSVDGLRDFIISLDKDKADKLRYKVEDEVVKIFITPYKGQISQDDLVFSQGDFNVDAVIALGVNKREELDDAIVSHGRILHDATIMTVSAGNEAADGLGTIHWNDPQASSISEMLVAISESLRGNLLNEAMATALLTGIVSATERFSNNKTTPKVMTMSAQLMAAGANQQLIAHNLQLDKPKPEAPAQTAEPEPVQDQQVPQEEQQDSPDLQIDHEKKTPPQASPAPQPKEETVDDTPSVKISPDGKIEHELLPDRPEPAKSEPESEDTAIKADRSLSEIEKEVGAHQADDTNSYLNPQGEKKIEPIHQNIEAEKPDIGGTFNATSQQALEEKQKQDESNHTILSHDQKASEEDTLPSGEPAEPEMSQADKDKIEHDKELEEARKALEAAAASAEPQVPEAKQSTASTPMQEQDSGEIQIDNSGTFNIPGAQTPAPEQKEQGSNEDDIPPPPPPTAPPVPPPLPKPPQNQ